MKLILIRHGETEWNRERRVQGRTDIKLNERGILQAQSIGKRLADCGICAVYSSPLSRALYTGEQIACGSGCPLYVRDGLTEIQFGVWEGRAIEEISRDYPGQWKNWGIHPELPAAEGAESLNEIENRAVRVVEEILSAHGANDTVAITSHTMPVKSIIGHYAGIPSTAFQRIRIDNCSYNMLMLYPDGGAQLFTMNDTTHLYKEGLL